MNHNTLSAILAALLVSASGLLADTIPGGDVSGTWYQSNSPYYIAGDITVPAGDTLTIEPGVVVQGLVSYGLTVQGWLEAVGTEADSIHFDWGNIRLNNAPDSSHLVYCTLSGGSMPLRCFNSRPMVSHCAIPSGGLMAVGVYNSSPRISDCIIENAGIGIDWWGDGGTISGSTIRRNIEHGVYAGDMPLLTFIDCVIDSNGGLDSPGPGVMFTSGNLAFTDCVISNNTTWDAAGGGVYCENGTATFTNCTISGNKAANPNGLAGGGGVYLSDAGATFSYCTIADNWGEGGWGWAAGAIAFDSGASLTIDHCTIDENRSFGSPAPCMCILGSGTAAITNSVISNHAGNAIYNNAGALTVEYSDVTSNPAIYGSVPAGFGVLDTVNRNGDSCDVYCNIFMDPMYADTANNDFHLTAGSPCIDAGDPESPPDPDGTIADMGAFFFFQTGLAEGRLPPDASHELRPTIVRGVLLWDCQPVSSGETGGCTRPVLLDAAGRTVMDLVPGENDVSGLAPGVYFCRLAAGFASSAEAQAQAEAVRKVVIQR